MNIVFAIGVLIFRNNKKEILLVKHGEKAGHPTGIYGIPAGRIDQGETEKEAAVRELQEETGLETSEADLKPLPYDFGVTSVARKVGVLNCTWKVFVCQKFQGNISKGGEETIPEWVKIADLSKYWLVVNTETAVSQGLLYT